MLSDRWLLLVDAGISFQSAGPELASWNYITVGLHSCGNCVYRWVSTGWWRRTALRRTLWSARRRRWCSIIWWFREWTRPDGRCLVETASPLAGFLTTSHAHGHSSFGIERAGTTTTLALLSLCGAWKSDSCTFTSGTCRQCNHWSGYASHFVAYPPVGLWEQDERPAHCATIAPW